MQKNKGQKCPRPFLFWVIGLILALGVVFSSPAIATQPDFDAPIPAKKPEVEAANDFISDLLRDFTKTLLDFGSAPPPPDRPSFFQGGSLSDAEAAKYKKIFSLQAAGRIEAADRVFEDLKDYRLRGHVLYQRYMHPTAYRASFKDLDNWMTLYADHPGAERIYKLALARMPDDAFGAVRQPDAPRVRSLGYGRTGRSAEVYRSDKARSQSEAATVRSFKQSVINLISKSRYSQAISKLENSDDAALLDDVELDLLRSRMAAAMLYDGKTQRAYDIAHKAAGRSGLHVPLAGWVAGISAWMEGDYKNAAQYFEITARSSYSSDWTASAGAFWAARAYKNARKHRDHKIWLARAADNQRTFYGLIATRALGEDFTFNWDVPEFDDLGYKRLRSYKAGARAMDLVKAGQLHLAEAELMQLDVKDNALRDTLLAYANTAGLPALAMRLGNSMSSDDGGLYDAALYPTGGWQPKEGFKIDPALIHAIMRQESKFDTTAKSSKGARGLMQIMPRTASYVAGSKGMGKHQLLDPETNLELGQRYLGNLLDAKYVDYDIVRLLIAYNAGPGNLSRWARRWPDVEDPLLFVELIGASETRAYVERVLANYWIYRLREELETPTLDALADDKPALYLPSQHAAVVTEDEEVKVATSQK